MENKVKTAVLVMVLLTLTLSEIGASAQQRYRIEAVLDEEQHVIDGVEQILWQNNSHLPATKLYFHLYLNAFAHDKTVFMRERGYLLRNRKLSRPGNIEVLSLRTKDGVDLTSQISTDVMENDATQMVVSLAEPVVSGGQIELFIRFRSRLPEIVVRSGYHRKFNMVAQWFPKIARRETNGRWVTFPYHGLGEFYSDFADYEVSIDVPHQYIVGSTGKRVSSRREGRRRIDIYRADNVHDMAWCAYPFFQEHISRISGVEVHILAPRYDVHLVEVHREAVRQGISYFGNMLGAYPYSTLTVIVPPIGAEGAMGMEYPTLFVTANQKYAMPQLPATVALPQFVTLHELAHQWFQGLVANNELEDPVLDEGLSQWLSLDLYRQLRQTPLFGLLSDMASLDPFEVVRNHFLWSRKPMPSSLLSADKYTFNQYVHAVYSRPALAFETIKRTWGREKFIRAISSYAREFRFKYPEKRHLFKAFDKIYWIGFSKQVLVPMLSGEVSMDAHIKSSRVYKKKGKWHASISAERMGNVPIPIWISYKNIHGIERLRVWPPNDANFTETVVDDVQIVSITLDPYRKNLLDSSLIDNRSLLNNREYNQLLRYQLLSWGQAFLFLLGL